ncbi:MAG TPA: DUF6314 family protein [Stellaceae bacterium]|nr:DUF6314 family protein [Stellaceae bacterium]
MAGFFTSLTGSWLLDRAIDDGSSMVGGATIVPRSGGGFGYREQGRLTLPGGQVLDGERRYIFVEEVRGFAVLFAEAPPRLFHRVALRRERTNFIGTATHLCGADRYDSRYAFGPGGGFVIEHRVSGPRKRYTIVTRYSRSGSPAA